MSVLFEVASNRNFNFTLFSYLNYSVEIYGGISTTGNLRRSIQFNHNQYPHPYDNPTAYRVI